MGFNLAAITDFVVGQSALLNLKVVDSGFGFLPSEMVDIVGGSTDAVGFAGILYQGIGSGRYKQKGGFLSDTKKLFDAWFYQNYSYQVISSVLLTKYRDMLLAITHPSGMLMFGKFQYHSLIENPIEVTSSTHTIT